MAADDAVRTLLDLDEGEICHCPCHSHPGMRHIAACCHRCPECGRRISMHKMREHESKCPARAD